MLHGFPPKVKQKEVPGCCHATAPMPENSAQHKEKRGEEGGALQKECKIRAKTQIPQSRGQSQLDKNLAMGGELKSAGVGKGAGGGGRTSLLSPPAPHRPGPAG